MINNLNGVNFKLIPERMRPIITLYLTEGVLPKGSSEAEFMENVLSGTFDKAELIADEENKRLLGNGTYDVFLASLPAGSYGSDIKDVDNWRASGGISGGVSESAQFIYNISKDIVNDKSKTPSDLIVDLEMEGNSMVLESSLEELIESKLFTKAQASAFCDFLDNTISRKEYLIASDEMKIKLPSRKKHISR